MDAQTQLDTGPRWLTSGAAKAGASGACAWSDRVVLASALTLELRIVAP